MTMSLDAVIARMSATERAEIVADLAGVYDPAKCWDCRSDGTIRLEKRTAKFLELVVDELRNPEP